MLTLHSLLGDHAVFQRGKPINISGKAVPGKDITVTFAGEKRTAAANSEGAWEIAFPAREAGGPFEVVVEGEERELRLNDIMVGEVWLCSGQSNMEWTLAMTPGTEADIAAATDPLIRCFTVMRTPAQQPASEAEGHWENASPRTAGTFSAVAWYFARQLRAKLGCAVGVIVPAFGGTRIASWLPEPVLAARPEYAQLMEEEALAEEELLPHKDTGRSPETAGWETAEWVDAEWEALEVPGFWQDQGWQLNGAVWYRTTVDLPEGWKGKDLVLRIGACDDFDDTFVNGERVGGMGSEAPSAYATRREYPVSAQLTSAGRLVIAVRVFDEWGFGGIVKSVCLHPPGIPEEKLSLEGTWKAKVERALPLRVSSRPIPAKVLYNGMVHPMLGAAIRGFLWYQGESDVERAVLYRSLLPDLIKAWRAAWRDDSLPFGIVQLANHKTRGTEPGDSNWAMLRDAQLLTARTVPGTGLAVIIDTGEADNIHPRRKAPVGERLARWALAEVYDLPEEPYGSPLVEDFRWESGAAVIRFSQTGSGLRSRDGGKLQAFQIAQADGRWQWAAAEIIAPDTVRVSAPGVSEPMTVRYGWQDNPDCNLENSAGLPASPFRTDEWE